MDEVVKAAEVDWTIIAAATGIGLILLITGIVVTILIVRWVFRVNQTSSALQTIIKQLEGLEKALGAMPERPAGRPQDISAVQADLRKMGAVISDIRELMAKLVAQSFGAASGDPADKSGWQRALKMAETGPVEETPPAYQEDLAAEIGLPSGKNTVKEDIGNEDIPSLDDIGETKKAEKREESGVTHQDTPGKSSRPKTVRARAVKQPSAPPDQGSVISLRELNESLEEDGREQDTDEAADGNDDFEIVGQKVTDGLQGKTLMGHVLISDHAVPGNEDAFSVLSDRASRGFFGMYPNAAAVQVDFYRLWEGKYLLMGTYEWRKHTTTGAGIRKTWHLHGVPESWITYEKEDAPWGLRRE